MPKYNTYFIVLIIVITSVIVAITMGIRHSFGIFLDPYLAVDPAGRQIFGFAIALQNLLWGALGAILGRVSDRYGTLYAILIGGLTYGIGLLFMSQLSAANLIMGNLFVGIGMAGAGLSIGVTAVGKIVSAKWRALSMGLITAAASFGQFLFTPIIKYFYDGFGWAGAFIWLSTIAFAIVPLSFCYYTKKSVQQVRTSMKEVVINACYNRNYILLVIGFYVCGFHLVFVLTHYVAYLTEKSISSQVAAWAISLIGLFNILGTLFFSWLGSHYPKSIVLSAIYFMRGFAFLAIIFIPTGASGNAMAVAFGVVIGFLWLTTVPLTSGLVADFFGAKNLSMLYGIVFFSHQLGSFTAAWLGSVVRDISGSYQPMWIISIVLALIASLLHYLINESKPQLSVA